MRVSRLVPIVVCIGASSVLFSQDRRDPPQFRTGVELVQLDVAVLDGERRAVRGLGASDFTVLDNGVETPIRAFTPIVLAGAARATEAVWSRDIAPDVATNQAGKQEGRLVVILLDRSIPVQQPTVTARRIATAAVEALGPNDLGAVITTSNGAVQNLTADRARLLRAINHGDPSTGISPEQEAIMGKLDPLQDPRCTCGLCVLETITRVAEAVEETPRRRKVLLFIGSSIVWQSYRPISQARADVGCEGRLRDARAAMFAAVDRANVTVHSIDPQGLVNVGPQVRAGAPGGFDRPDNPAAAGPATRLRQQQTDTTDTLTGQESLKVLPARTGGRTIVGRNDPEQLVPAIFSESEAYYVLGIERTRTDRPDRIRSLEVKVNRKGLRAYTQRKYVAPSVGQAASAPAVPLLSLDEALHKLMPTAGVPLGLGVTTFANPDGPGAIVRISVDAAAFAHADGSAAPLDVAVLAVDGTGKPVGSARQTSTISGARSSAAAVEATVASHLMLPPGDYGIRVAVAEPAISKIATVFADASVPDFDRARLSLSSVNVNVAPAAPAPAAATLRRVFRRTEQVRAVLQIYQGLARTDPIAPVSVRVQIVDAKGAAVRDQSLPFTETMFTSRRAECVIAIPVANLPAGEYLLKLDAETASQRTGRALRFAVE
jgi:VWFA-related protein